MVADQIINSLTYILGIYPPLFTSPSGDSCILLLLILKSLKVFLTQNYCKTQLMDRDDLNQQHVMQCYASDYHVWLSFYS